jgi:hypothetical protein
MPSSTQGSIFYESARPEVSQHAGSSHSPFDGLGNPRMVDTNLENVQVSIYDKCTRWFAGLAEAKEHIAEDRAEIDKQVTLYRKNVAYKLQVQRQCDFFLKRMGGMANIPSLVTVAKMNAFVRRTITYDRGEYNGETLGESPNCLSLSSLCRACRTSILGLGLRSLARLLTHLNIGLFATLPYFIRQQIFEDVMYFMSYSIGAYDEKKRRHVLVRTSLLLVNKQMWVEGSLAIYRANTLRLNMITPSGELGSQEYAMYIKHRGYSTGYAYIPKPHWDLLKSAQVVEFSYHHIWTNHDFGDEYQSRDRNYPDYLDLPKVLIKLCHLLNSFERIKSLAIEFQFLGYEPDNFEALLVCFKAIRNIKEVKIIEFGGRIPTYEILTGEMEEAYWNVTPEYHDYLKEIMETPRAPMGQINSSINFHDWQRRRYLPELEASGEPIPLIDYGRGIKYFDWVQLTWPLNPITPMAFIPRDDPRVSYIAHFEQAMRQYPEDIEYEIYDIAITQANRYKIRPAAFGHAFTFRGTLYEGNVFNAEEAYLDVKEALSHVDSVDVEDEAGLVFTTELNEVFLRIDEAMLHFNDVDLIYNAAFAEFYHKSSSHNRIERWFNGIQRYFIHEDDAAVEFEQSFRNFLRTYPGLIGGTP